MMLVVGNIYGDSSPVPRKNALSPYLEASGIMLEPQSYIYKVFHLNDPECDMWQVGYFWSL